MGTVPVKIDELGFGFEAQNDEHASWLHRPTGRIVILETLLLNRLKDDDETDARLSFADIVDEDPLPRPRHRCRGRRLPLAPYPLQLPRIRAQDAFHCLILDWATENGGPVDEIPGPGP